MQRSHYKVVKVRIAIQRSWNFEGVRITFAVAIYGFIPCYESAGSLLSPDSSQSTHELNETFERIHKFPHDGLEQRGRVQTCNEPCSHITSQQRLITHHNKYSVRSVPVVAMTSSRPMSKCMVSFWLGSRPLWKKCGRFPADVSSCCRRTPAALVMTRICEACSKCDAPTFSSYHLRVCLNQCMNCLHAVWHFDLVKSNLWTWWWRPDHFAATKHALLHAWLSHCGVVAHWFPDLHLSKPSSWARTLSTLGRTVADVAKIVTSYESNAANMVHKAWNVLYPLCCERESSKTCTSSMQMTSFMPSAMACFAKRT